MFVNTVALFDLNMFTLFMKVMYKKNFTWTRPRSVRVLPCVREAREGSQL